VSSHVLSVDLEPNDPPVRALLQLAQHDLVA
jgi:hypothetical protein